MRTLIIGGSGFVGTHFAQTFNSGDVAYFSRHGSEILDSAGIEYIKGDVTDPESVMSAVENFDVIYDLAGIWVENDQKFNDVHINGVKNIVAALKKYDRDQRLIYFSTMNTDFGITEFYRSKRIAEDNVFTWKNGLVVKPSTIFGEGDAITKQLIRVGSRRFGKFPGLGNLAPVHVSEVAKVMHALTDQTGTIYICSSEKIDAVDAMNLVRKKKRMRLIKPVTKKVAINKLLNKLADKGVSTYDELYSLSMNRFRESTYLPRVVKEPQRFREYMSVYLSKI